MVLPIQCAASERAAWLDDAEVRVLLALAARQGVKAAPLTPALFGVSTGPLTQAIRVRLRTLAGTLGVDDYGDEQ